MGARSSLPITTGSPCSSYHFDDHQSLSRRSRPCTTAHDATAPRRLAKRAQSRGWVQSGLLLFSLTRAWRGILRVNRLSARCKIFGSALFRFLMTRRHSSLAGCCARFTFACVLRGRRDGKQGRGDGDGNDAFHCWHLLVVRTSAGQSAPNRAKLRRLLQVEFSFVTDVNNRPAFRPKPAQCTKSPRKYCADLQNKCAPAVTPLTTSSRRELHARGGGS